MTALRIPSLTEHERNVLREGRYLALATADAAWLWRVVCNLEETLDNPECAYFKRAEADYNAAALRVRLYTERLLARLAGRENEDGEAFERYTGYGVNGTKVTVEFWRGIHMVTAKID